GNGSPRSDAAMAGGLAARAAERPQARAIPRTPPRRPPLRAEEPVRRSRVRLAGALLVGAAAAAAVVFVLVQLTSPGNSPSASAGARTATGAAHGGKHGTASDPSKVTVAVLNGTSTLLLASRVASRLKAIGYKEVPPANAATQTYQASVVAYMRGHRSEALEVARSLKLKPSAVQLIDSTTQAVACPSAPCSATVVVVAGTDLASQ
ncbi:MAG: LytR C-terminal domain-containing protein, partial [Actinomycetota bacterium]|nr:LytR C-terminal domain-containing protein [Actinomycetota bacterium]